MPNLEHLLHLGNDCQVVTDLAMSLKMLDTVSRFLSTDSTWVRRRAFVLIVVLHPFVHLSLPGMLLQCPLLQKAGHCNSATAACAWCALCLGRFVKNVVLAAAPAARVGAPPRLPAQLPPLALPRQELAGGGQRHVRAAHRGSGAAHRARYGGRDQQKRHHPAQAGALFASRWGFFLLIFVLSFRFDF